MFSVTAITMRNRLNAVTYLYYYDIVNSGTVTG